MTNSPHRPSIDLRIALRDTLLCAALVAWVGLWGGDVVIYTWGHWLVSHIPPPGTCCR